jgi:hypothetical protein
MQEELTSFTIYYYLYTRILSNSSFCEAVCFIDAFLLIYKNGCIAFVRIKVFYGNLFLLFFLHSGEFNNILF